MVSFAIYAAVGIPVTFWFIHRYGNPHWPSMFLTGGLVFLNEVANAIERLM